MFQMADILTSRYQLQQRLGNTAKGHQTWLAVDLDSSENVTIKLLAFSPENFNYLLPPNFLKPECTHIRLIKNATFFKISIPIKPFHRKTLKLIFKEIVDGLGIVSVGMVFLFLCIIFFVYFFSLIKASPIILGIFFVGAMMFFILFILVFLLLLLQLFLMILTKFLIRESSLLIQDKYCIMETINSSYEPLKKFILSTQTYKKMKRFG
jgi:serine/threonine protein kinase